MTFTTRFFLLLAVVLTTTAHYSQVQFKVNSLNCYTIHDSVKDITYSFDSGSEHSNLFDKGKFDYKFGGISLAQNAYGSFKLIKKGRIRPDVPGLGSIRTNANILGNEEFSKDNCIPFDLLLGARVMKKHKLHFDNRHGVLTSLDALPANIGEYMKLELKHGFFTQDYYTILEINGKKQKFLVDTGYSGQITMKPGDSLSNPSTTLWLLRWQKLRLTVMTIQLSGTTALHLKTM